MSRTRPAKAGQNDFNINGGDTASTASLQEAPSSSGTNFGTMPGHTLTKRELRARLRSMQTQLREVRKMRKDAQKEVKDLTLQQQAINETLFPSTSLRPSSRDSLRSSSRRSARSSARKTSRSSLNTGRDSLLSSIATSRSNLSSRGKMRQHFESRRKQWGDFSVAKEGGGREE